MTFNAVFISASIVAVLGLAAFAVYFLRQAAAEAAATSEETGEHPLSVKTLIDTTDNSAVLWSVTERAENSGRRCFGQNATGIDCNTADQRWKDFMSN